MRRRAALALLLPLIVVWPVVPALGSSVHPSLPAGTAPSTATLRLNELDYDQPGIDTGEFVEIVNTGTERARLRHVALVFVNGTTSAEVRRVQLSGPLGPARRVVVATSSVAVQGSARVIPLPLARDNIQNGAPDAVVLVDTAADVVLDALSYEGVIADAAIDGLPGTVSTVEGTPASEVDGNETAGSLCRLPDRADTDDDDRDWALCPPTPGVRNSRAES